MSRENSKVLIFFLSGVICFLVAFILIQSIRTDVAVENDSFEKIAVSEKPVATTTVKQERTAEVIVYVTGAVNSPGVIKLTQGARIYEAIESAGGFSDTADEGSLNLSRIARDGEHIRVAHIKNRKVSSAPETEPVSVKKTSVRERNVNYSRIVNINTAGTAELDTLPGIGPKTAEKIVAYRKSNGSFKTIEDIMKVKGIGPKKFEKMKGLITIGN